jgi:hypothetical protein
LANYHNLLEALLQNDGLDVEIVNVSVGEYELPDELDLLRRFGARYGPDLVLHGLFVGNDLFVPKGTLMSYHGISVRSSGLFASYRPRNFLLREWLKHYMRVLHDRNLREVEIDCNEPSGTFSQELFLEIEKQRLNICRIQPNPNVRWQRTIELLDEIRREINQMGAKYVMVIHPDQFQVDNELVHQIEEKYNLDLGDYDFNIPQKFLRSYCVSKRVPYLDLLPIFRSNRSGRGLYLLRDTHYNKDGNSLAANAIYNFLCGQGLITCETNRS